MSIVSSEYGRLCNNCWSLSRRVHTYTAAIELVTGEPIAQYNVECMKSVACRNLREEQV